MSPCIEQAQQLFCCVFISGIRKKQENKYILGTVLSLIPNALCSRYVSCAKMALVSSFTKGISHGRMIYARIHPPKDGCFYYTMKNEKESEAWFI